MLCITNNWIKHQSFFYTQFKVKTVLFQTIQLNISTQFISIWLVDRTLWGTTTLDKRGPGSDGNEGVLCIPQSSSKASPSDWSVSYPGHSLGEYYPSAEMQLVYSIAAANWARRSVDVTVDIYFIDFDHHIGKL